MLQVRGYRVPTAEDGASALGQAQPEMTILLIGLREMPAANVAWCPAKMATCELVYVMA